MCRLPDDVPSVRQTPPLLSEAPCLEWWLIMTDILHVPMILIDIMYIYICIYMIIYVE